MGFVRNLTGADDRKKANQQMGRSMDLERQTLDLSKQQFEWQKQLAADNTAYMRNQAQEEQARINADYESRLKYGGEDYARKLGIASHLIDNAKLTPGDYAHALSTATGSVKDQFGRAKSEAMRHIGSYGINPNSGKFAGMEGDFARSEAAAAANAENAARMGLRNQERTDIANANIAAMGISDPRSQITRNGSAPIISDSSLGLSNPTIGITNSQAATASQRASDLNASASSKLGSLIEAGAMIAAA